MPRHRRKSIKKVDDKFLSSYTSPYTKTTYKGIAINHGRVWNVFQVCLEVLRTDIVHIEEQVRSAYNCLTIGPQVAEV